eukprot:XP_028343906.1 sperm flagellar protein 1-like [Physeter catodon]
MAPPLNQDEELAELYHWVDTIPLSRPKRNISRDFSDGVLMAEVISYCTPKLVELHNYSAANAVERKSYNWSTLNQKVFRRLGMRLEPQEIQDIVNARPGAVEKVLALYRQQAAEYSARITEQDAAFAGTTPVETRNPFSSAVTTAVDDSLYNSRYRTRF